MNPDEVNPVETGAETGLDTEPNAKPVPKERVKLTHSTWAKVGAIVLLYVSLLCVIACAACFLFFAYAGLADAYNLRSLLDFIDLDLAGGQFVYDLVLFAVRLYSACVPVGIVFIALMLACLIFLFCAAGHRKGETAAESGGPYPARHLRCRRGHCLHIHFHILHEILV